MTHHGDLGKIRPGNWPFTLKIQLLDSGKQLLQAQGFANVPQPGPVVLPIKFGAVRIEESGAYSIVTEVQGQTGMIVTDFSVILQPPIGSQPQSGPKQ